MLAVDNSFTLVSELVAANILSVVICCTQASQMDLILYLAVMYFFVTLHAYTVLQGVVTNVVHVHAPVVAAVLLGNRFTDGACYWFTLHVCLPALWLPSHVMHLTCAVQMSGRVGTCTMQVGAA